MLYSVFTELITAPKWLFFDQIIHRDPRQDYRVSILARPPTAPTLTTQKRTGKSVKQTAKRTAGLHHQYELQLQTPREAQPFKFSSTACRHFAKLGTYPIRHFWFLIVILIARSIEVNHGGKRSRRSGLHNASNLEPAAKTR